VKETTGVVETGVESPMEDQPAEMQASLKRPLELADEQKVRLELDCEREKVELPC
jgi:hypothetical protein